MRPARVLVLNGSPCPNGQSMGLARALLQSFPSNARIIQLYRMRLLPCIACYRCATSHVCPVEDDMPSTLQAVFDSDILVLVSPLHFTSVSAPLVAWYSRLQPFWQANKAGKPPPALPRAAVLVVTGGAHYPRMFEPARAVTAAAMNSLGVQLLPTVSAADTDTRPAVEDAAALTLVHTVAGMVAELLQ